jgi:hypothetical protein
VTVFRIRPLEREDLPAVSGLLTRRFPQAREVRDPASLAALLLDHPWADPAIPSLVAVDADERVAGFVGAHPRRFRVGERTVRAAFCSHLAVDEGWRTGAAGALLLGRFMAGPQDFSYSDTAIELVVRMWTAFGGRSDPVRSLVWMQVLRPGAWATRAALRLASRRGGDGRALVPVRTLPLTRGAGAEADALDVRPLAPGELAAAAGELGLDPAPAYDDAWLRWVLARLDGEILARALRRGPKIVGWYVVALDDARAARVLQVAARPREIDAVLGRMLADAREAGAVVVGGRAEPHLLEALRARGCALGFGDRFVAHAQEPELLDALRSERGLLSRLDGEFW